ncbi:MAG: hypothetical protein IPL39_11440 [Opitutaceae bacterium]|nr:hypothetical protein [Opitutaceae bacterium]
MTPQSYARRLCAGFLLLALGATIAAAQTGTPPAVTSDPLLREVASGASLVLAPTLEGDPVTATQWFRNGVAIDGATGVTLPLASVDAADAGYYTAVFTNAAGSTTVAVAAVEVDGVPVPPDTSASSYRLMEYFYPASEGAEWLYAGLDATTHTTVHTRVTLADLDRAVTCLTGRHSPQSYQVTTTALAGAYGSYAAGVFTPTKTWTDYMGASPTGLVMWGDDYTDGESVRLDGSYAFPGTMRLGQTAERTADYYEHGAFVCPVTAFFQLLSVDTVDTPAGRFHGSLHVRIVLQAPGNLRIWDEWWVAGLGKVRNQWIAGSGLRADSRLVSTTRPVAPTYRLADYFVRPITGSVFHSTGKSWNNSDSHTVSTITGTSVPITTYTGGTFPLTPGTPVTQLVMADQNVSSATDGTVQETWAEYITTASGLVYWGLDNPTEVGSVRFENGAALPVVMAVGETVVVPSKAYLNGLYVGTGSLTVRLLGVENCTVPAGTFANCLRLEFTVAIATNSQTYEMWLAPEVGCVRYLATAGGGDRERNLVTWAVPSAPAFSSQSTLESCPLNGTAQLSVMAVGTADLSFQWYRGSAGDVSTPVGTNSHLFTTPALTAWTRYWVRATNGVGSADSATMLVMPAGGTMTLADWVLLDPLPANQRGALNTPAGDGVTNRMKFALGVAPMGAATLSLPKPVVVAGTGSNRHLGLEFTRNLGAQGISLVLDVSSDLVNWGESAATLEPLAGTPGVGLQNVRLRQNLVLGADVRRFARLKVTAP